MRVENLSWGHWLVIAIIVGALTAWMQCTIGAGNETQTGTQLELERLLLREPLKATNGKEYPYIIALVIYPKVQAGFAIPTTDGTTIPSKTLITFRVLGSSADRKGWEYKPSSILASVPYQPIVRRVDDPNLTAQSYFKTLAESAPWIRFRYAWWAEPVWVYVLWISGSIVVIGIVWPTILRMLIKAGYGTREEKVSQPSLLSRMFGGPKSHRPQTAPAAPRPSPTQMSSEELARLDKMEQELQEFLKPTHRPEDDEDDALHKAPAIRELNATPVTTPTEEPKTQEQKDYAGEFYPTVAHGKKKDA